MKFAISLLLTTSLFLSNIEASNVNKCLSCNVYATGMDGTLWGWEDGSFCKLSSSCSETKIVTPKKTTTVYKKSSTASEKTTTKKSSTTSKNTTSPSKNESTSITTTTTTTTAPIAHETDAKGNLVCNGCVVTSTGGDNSLWGYEDDKSCIIDQTKCEGKMEENKPNANAESNHKKDSTGNLICNQCEVTATGGDGSYWGWEDEASCIMDNVKCNLSPPKTKQKVLERGPDGILICNTCEYTRIDPDTTTWNTENGEDCRVIGSRCGINTTPHPWCSGCVVTGTGNDGALYGWENNASCLINEVSCGISPNHNQYGQVSSDGTSQQRITFLYYVIASLATIFIVRGF